MSAAAAEEIRIPAPELRGGNLDLMSCRDTEVCLDGAAGTGKTFAALYKVHALLLAYPGAKALVCRKSNTDLSGSALATYRDAVVDEREGVQYFGGNKVKPAGYVYPNGSFLAVNGLDKPSKVRSAEFDIALINEATECDEQDLEFVRMRLRKGVMPYQQVIMDVNPDYPTHWLNQRMNAGVTTRLLSRHEDNPRFWNTVTQDWTDDGRRYVLGILEGLTGVRLARFRYGMWTAAEGTVYEDAWSRAHNLVQPELIPKEWPRYLAIDFGYTNPFVCLWAAHDPDGRLHIYRQLYMTHRLVEDHAVTIAEYSGWYHLLPKDHTKHADKPASFADPLPRAIICDHDAEDRKTLERHLGLHTIAAQKSVSDGIQAVASRFRVAGDGKPRLTIARSSLIERDLQLAAEKKPTRLEEEPDGYVWRQGGGIGAKEAPVKENDHGCLVAGTLITTVRGDVPIERVQVGEYVLTRNGYKRVVAAGMTQKNAETYTVRFSNGATLTGTGNHPVYRNGEGYNSLRTLRYGDIIMTTGQAYERLLLCLCIRANQNVSFIKALSSGATRSRLAGHVVTTTDQTHLTLKKALKRFMWKYGKMPMALYRMAGIFTTKTIIRSTMPLKTLSAFRQKSINCGTQFMKEPPGCGFCENTLHQKFERLQKHGTHLKKAERGIKLLAHLHGKQPSTNPIHVNNVGKNFNQEQCGMVTLVSALITAKQRLGVSQALIASRECVNNADMSLRQTSIQTQSTAQEDAPSSVAIQMQEKKRFNAQFARNHSQQTKPIIENVAQEDVLIPYVVCVEKENVRSDVYNLTVENAVGEGEYFANGVLVHNCDALRYLVAHFDLNARTVEYLPTFWR